MRRLGAMTLLVCVISLELRHLPPRILRRAHAMVVRHVWAVTPLPGRESRDLGDLHPAFRARVTAVLERLAARGHRAAVHRTWRDPVRQRAYRAVGASRVSWGLHCATGAEGHPEALAADIAPVGLRTDEERARFWRALRDAAEAEGLVSGGRWTRSGVWRTAYPDIGWDPGHVQIAGTTLGRVRNGWRP